MRVLVIGAVGQFGQDLLWALTNHQVEAPSHATLDLEEESHVFEYINDTRPEAVINTGAFHDVPLCETEPSRAFAVNAVGTWNLARACRAADAKFFHVSTDYVFDGSKGTPYVENDAPRPLMVYGASKLAGEHLSLAEWDKTFIVRTTGLFGKNPCRAKPGGRNFPETMLHLATTRDEVQVVNNQLCCPTYTPDLAKQLVAMLEEDIEPGVYHAATPPGCSWYEFATMIFETAGVDIKITPVGDDTFPVSFKRPRDSRLSCAALKRLGIFTMRPLNEVLTRYLGTKTRLDVQSDVNVARE